MLPDRRLKEYPRDEFTTILSYRLLFKSLFYIVSRFYPYILNGNLILTLKKNNNIIKINIQSYDTEKAILKELENYGIHAVYDK